MKKNWTRLYLALLLPVICLATPRLSAQVFNAGAVSGQVVTPYGGPAINAKVYVCLTTSTGIPCSPLATLYSDNNLTQNIPNPLTTDANGNYKAFLTAGLYTVQVVLAGSQATQASVYYVAPGGASGGAPAGGNTGAVQFKNPDGSLGGDSPAFTYDPNAHTLTVPNISFINSANVVSKGPKADVNYSDFSVGCSAGNWQCIATNDVTYIANNPVNGQYRCLYFPAGNYQVNGTIYLPANVNVCGDGPWASSVQETNASSPLFVTTSPVGTAIQGSVGTWTGIALYGSGHTQTGSLLMLLGGPITMVNVMFYNSGGAGIVGYETAERSNFVNVNMAYVRWPVVVGGFEYRFFNFTFYNPGVDASGYCESPVNCTNGTLNSVLVPDNRHAAIWQGFAYSVLFSGGEVKPLTYLSGYKINNANNIGIFDTYPEGFSNSVNTGLILGGQPDQVHGVGTSSTCTVGANNYFCIPAGSDGAWWPSRIGHESDIPTWGQTAGFNNASYVFCPDYTPGSSSPCAANPSVLQDQYEIAQVVFAEDTGKLYFLTRNESGSTTSPTTWTNPVIDLPMIAGGSTGSGLTIARNHWVVNNPNSLSGGHTANCSDATNPCQEWLIGGLDDGFIHYQGGSGTAGTNIAGLGQITAVNDVLAAGAGSEASGYQWIKVASRGSINYNDLRSMTSGESQEITGTGTVSLQTTVPNITAISANATYAYNASNLNFINSQQNGTQGPTYLAKYMGFKPAGIGAGPGGNYNTGFQFYGQKCDAGVANASSNSFRSCLVDYNDGGPYLTTQTSADGGTTWTDMVKLAPNRIFLVNGSGTQNLVSSTLTGGRFFTMPDANSNPVQPLSAAPAGGCVGWIDSSGVQHGASCASISGSPTTGKATCWKTATQIGYCSTQPDSTGSCTCN